MWARSEPKNIETYLLNPWCFYLVYFYSCIFIDFMGDKLPQDYLSQERMNKISSTSLIG